MSGLDIFFKYKFFLREKITKEYLSNYEIYSVIGENIIDGYYVVLFETEINKETGRFIIVENIDNPAFSKMKVLPKNDAYITMSKSHLHHLLPKKCKSALAKRGYASSIKIGEKKDSRFCWHRLVACLYYNCLGLEVHHIGKNPKFNDIMSLVPLDKEIHGIVDNDGLNGDNLAKERQKQLKAKYFKKKNTLATRDETVLKILNLKTSGMKTPEIIKVMKKQIRKSSVYKILNHFFYAEDFLKWFKTFNPRDPDELYGNLGLGWMCIILFELEYTKLFFDSAPSYND